MKTIKTLKDARRLPATHSLRSRRLRLEIAAQDPISHYKWVRVLRLGVTEPGKILRFWICITDPRLVRQHAGRGWVPINRVPRERLLRAEAIADAFTDRQARIMLDVLIRYGSRRDATLEFLAKVCGPAWDTNAMLFRMRLDYTIQRLTVHAEDQRHYFRWQSAREAVFDLLEFDGITTLELAMRGPVYDLAITGAEIL